MIETFSLTCHQSIIHLATDEYLQTAFIAQPFHVGTTAERFSEKNVMFGDDLEIL